MPKESRANMHVRIPTELKGRLELEAAKKNLSLNDYVQLHLQEILDEYPEVTVEDDIKVAPPQYAPPYGIYSPVSYPTTPYFPYGGGRGRRYFPMPPPDATDALINDMRKWISIKMMRELLVGGSTPEQFMAAVGKQGLLGKRDNGEDWSWDKWMRFQAMQQQNDAKMMQLMWQYQMANKKGDTGEKDRLAEMITALMSAQMQQSQAFLQQYMATNQANTQAQQSLFQTALQTGQQGSQQLQQQQQQHNEALTQLRQEFWNAQQENLRQYYTLQFEHIKEEMDRIRQEKGKDTLAQLAELIELRDKSPVYKAAFDAAFNVQHESMIGKIIPQLKDLGVDKVIENISAAAAAYLRKPKKVPPPSTPAPSTIPLPQKKAKVPLEELRLPKKEALSTSSKTKTSKPKGWTPTPQPPETTTPIPKKTEKLPESAIGYTNLDVLKKAEETKASKVKKSK